ncbi:uncharacterized protein RhoGAP102A isoform X2 [Halyomorpha halys]|uniref:uncharacterized protein RhoGAP102A isoform X2 n=1 Tax=Halyomorpha halys TaxID=286706 RepID=UPI000D0C84F4|nr:uncharacterized protein LOC106682438 isoform X2 [Halyomorpha halys]
MDPGPSRYRRNSSSMGKPSPGSPKKKGPKKERWLLTRKTWRYMADAGRKLIPEGHNKPEDIPKIEAYFQEVCNKEPKFLLWRKQSYPGAVGFRRGRSRGGRKKGGSCRDRTSSADEAEDLKSPYSRESPQPSTSRFDIQKMREEFLFGKNQEESSGILVTLERYLSQPQPGSLDTVKLVEKLKEHLANIEREGRERIRHVEFEGDRSETSLLDTLRRYYSKSTNRDKVISDLLTDRKKLESLYFDLRKARGFSSRCGGGTPYTLPSRWLGSSREWRRGNEDVEEEETTEDTGSTNPGSPTFIIEAEDPVTNRGTQTETITPQSWVVIADQVKKLRELREAEQEKENKAAAGGAPRRSSVDNDDVSPSVSDTIKRYLRMARKKSVDSDKIDRFKRVNYDRNLRNIKGKGEPSISEDDGLDKNAQTDEAWIEALRDLKIDTLEVESAVNSSRSSLAEEPVSPTSPTTKSFLSSGQSFLSNLLHGLQDRSVPTGGMQKSKSSTSVVQQGSRLVSKKIWKSRSKSQSRATPSATSVWTPKEGCVWNNVAGRTVTLTDTSLTQLTEIERKILQKVALAKLQALNLGVNIRIPSESPAATTVQKPKRKAYLLKRKAITTGFFDTNRKDEKDKGETTTSTGGLVFGIPLSQCVENEKSRLSLRPEGEDTELRRKSRGSFSSLIESPRTDEKGSCESLIGGTLSMPGLDSISCGSTPNLSTPEGGVPTIVTSCLRHLENNGLHTLGIFRVSSSKKRVRQLREDFDCGKEINLEDELCPHDVATLLKEYFRDLPDSLLCKDLYQAFIQTQRIRNRRLQHEALQHLLQLLPVANRDTLLVLLSFLSIVANHADDQKDSSGQVLTGNKMDSSNLATLFAPNILHNYSKGTPSKKDELSTERSEERADAINVIRSLIDNHKTLFQVSAELLNEVYIHMMDTHPELLDQLLRRRDTSDDFDDSTSGGLDDPDRKYWSREACTHEGAATGGPDVSMRPRRLDRGRERVPKKRRDESRKRGDSESSSRRASDDKTRMSSSDSGHHTPEESNLNDGVITASLKIPVPSVTSFSLNLDDIPYIEDSDRQQITLGISKSSGSQPESGLGSFSPPTRPPSVTSWGSTPTSPECEPTTATITFPSSRHQPQLQRVTITNTSKIQQVQPSYAQSETYNMDKRHFASSTTYSRLLSTETKVTKSASSGAVVTQHERPITPSISSIGGAVLRSKTADIERMLRIQSKAKKTPMVEKDCKRRYTDVRHLTRHLVEEKTETSTSASESRGVWKRRELISSEPKERRNIF